MSVVAGGGFPGGPGKPDVLGRNFTPERQGLPEESAPLDRAQSAARYGTERILVTNTEPRIAATNALA